MVEQTELNLEEMPLVELKALAEKGPEEPVIAAADVELPKEDAEEPEQYVVKSQIDLDDGSGIQVFSGTGDSELEALRDLNNKLVEAQRNATKKIHDLNRRVKAEDTRTEQQKTDDEYVISQRLQKEPSKTMRQVVNEVISEREAATQRNLEAQQAFVDSHPDYVADPKSGNGMRMMSEFQRLNPGADEFTEQGLEKAYQSLKASGLLKLKTEEAGGTTEAETVETERIVPATVEATQPRSLKRSSTISTRGSSPTVVKTGPSEDELYSMPLDKLKNLANEQLAKGAE